MQKDMHRSKRRHHLARLKKKRLTYWWPATKTPKQIGMLAHTATICSCWMCCNVRRRDRNALTQQEKRIVETEKEFDLPD